jgi:arylsulfatase
VSVGHGRRTTVAVTGAAVARVFAGGLSLGLVACGSGAPPPPSPTDVVLIVVDTLRADRLSSYGYGRPTSPVLDRLAASGTRFADVTAQSSWTQPSMVSLTTGRYLSEQIYEPELDAPTLAEIFSDAGYRTLGFSGNVLLARGTGFARGFDHYDASPSASSERGYTRARDAVELLEGAWPTIEAALAEPERPPLFLYLHLFDPHAPYEHHPQWREQLPLRDFLEGEPLQWQQQRFAEAAAARGVDAAQHRDDWRELLVSRANHDLEIRHADHRLGEFLGRLQAAGLAADALHAFASDHGEGLWDHVAPGAAEAEELRRPLEFFYQEHGGQMHQEALRTPLFLWGRGVPAGRVIETPVENLDLYPTLLELCGLEPPAGLDGRSLVPALRGADAPRDFVFAASLSGQQVREVATDLVLLRVPEGFQGAGVQLFDLRRDPAERLDLAPQRPQDVARLSAVLDRWRAANPNFDPRGGQLDAEQLERLRALGYGELQLGAGAGGR